MTFRVNLLESAIESNNAAFCKPLGIIFRKLNFGEGWPDRILLYKGQVIFIEYKQLGAKPTALQEYMMDKLRKQGFEVYVIDDKERGRALIKEWHDRINLHLATVRGSDDQNQRSGPDVQRDLRAQ